MGTAGIFAAVGNHLESGEGVRAIAHAVGGSRPSGTLDQVVLTDRRVLFLTPGVDGSNGVRALRSTDCSVQGSAETDEGGLLAAMRTPDGVLGLYFEPWWRLQGRRVLREFPQSDEPEGGVYVHAHAHPVRVPSR
jgi:hypothetical protein